MADRRVFDDRTSAAEKVQAALPAALPSTLVAPLTDAIVSEFEVAPPEDPYARRLVVRRWAIRSEDLNVLRAILDPLVAGWAADSVAGKEAAAVGLIVGAFRAARTVRRKGILLSPVDAAVLGAIRESHGASTAELAARLGAGMSTAQIARSLSALGRCALADGSVVALAEQDARGVWHTTA